MDWRWIKALGAGLVKLGIWGGDYVLVNTKRFELSTVGGNFSEDRSPLGCPASIRSPSPDEGGTSYRGGGGDAHLPWLSATARHPWRFHCRPVAA